jgi:hypothetical protein
MLNKILALLALQRSSSNGLLIQQLLAGVGAVVFLSLTAAFLASVLIAGTVCLGYNLLVAYGLNEHAAMVALGVLLFFLMIALILTVLHYVRKIELLTKQILMIENPIASKVTGLVDAFISGFQSKRKGL